MIICYVSKIYSRLLIQFWMQLYLVHQEMVLLLLGFNFWVKNHKPLLLTWIYFNPSMSK